MVSGEIFATHTSDCQTFTALVDSEEEEDELFEVSLIVKQAVFGTGLYKINENTVVVTIFDPTLQSKHTCTIFIVSHYNYFCTSHLEMYSSNVIYLNCIQSWNFI